MVLGFNSSDDADMARDFMKECDFAFRTVLDSSDEATQVAFSDYKACCVPLHYVIGKDRKIALAQPGFEQGYKTILGTLARLGVETGVDPLPAPEKVKRKAGPARRGWEESADAEDDGSSIEKCSLSGRVVDENQRPVRGKRLDIRSGEHLFNVTIRTDEQGAYSLDGLKPGLYAVSFDARPGPAHWLKMQQIEPGQAAVIDFVPVEGAAGLAGEVLDPVGKPISSCNVSVSNINYCRKEGYQPFTVRTRTDSRGRFAFCNLNPGTYDTTISKRGEYNRSPMGKVLLGQGEEREITLSTHAGKVNGRIEIAGDPPAGTPSLWVRVTREGDALGRGWSVLASGLYTFEVQNLPSGKYQATAQLRGFFCKPAYFSVEEDGEPAATTITLETAGSILFKLSDKKGKPIEHANIALVIRDRGEITADQEKVSSGVFRVHSVAAGESLFRIKSSGHGSAETAVTVEPGEELTVDVKISEG